jgi:hypothetical protein
MIADDLEAMFARDVEIDIDGVLAAFERLKEKATSDSVPQLVSAMHSPRSNFWIRELLSEPICELGGSDYLDVLLDAAQLGLDEGYDNDGFHFHLTELAISDPVLCRAKLEQLLEREDFRHREAAHWLLDFCVLGESEP